MAILKCKMCGGDLNLIEGAGTAECEFCGSVQTVPKVDDEKKLTLFSRANRLRFGCEFDKAAGIYEAIVADFPEEAEAYWGLVLCKYGIEYVDDPATGKKVPTCHRSGFDSVLKDPNVEFAQEYADIMARRLYREEAKQIEELRKGIIEVSANEEPYDVFICYKETDFDGKRTLDSVLAMDIYEALTEKGYRVFFSRISLEDKLGTEYEPYIFAALNSAKIMLVVGTDYEYFNAVWVKNEWSRFLKLMAQDKEKHLIPCYKGIDAYDMPEEFARLQAQDLQKMGAIQDIVRGVQKLLPKQDKPNISQATPSAPGVDALLERAFMFLEDGKWADADAYCEKVLDIDPKCAQAYLAKMMAELRIKTKENLQAHIAQIVKNGNYQKILRFGDRELCDLLRSFEEQHNAKEAQLAREKQAKEEQLARERQMRIGEQKHATYNHVIKFLEQGEKSEAYKCLRKLSGYKDADALLEPIQKDIHTILAPVAQNGKYGYINEAGEMVIKPQFNRAYSFASNGLAPVEQNDKWGYINETGEMVIPRQFKWAGSFASNGLAPVERNYEYGYINEDGEIVIPLQFENAHSFASNGLALVEQNNKWGYINEAGEMVIKPQFNWANSFSSNGLAPVEQNDKWGYINETGEMVIPLQFEYAHSFAFNGLAAVMQNEKWGYINEAGKMVTMRFVDAETFESNGLARVKQNKWGWINESGEMVIPPQFEDAEPFASDGLARVQQNGKWTYITEYGSMVTRPQLEPARDFTVIFRSEVERVKQIQEEARQKANWRAAGLCQHCGNQLKGLFSKKCVSCGMPKDY